MIQTSLSDIIDDALGNTDRDVEDIDRGWLTRVAIKQVRNLWSLCIRLNRDQFTKTSATFTIASGNQHTIGTGDSVTDYLSFRGLEYDPGNGKFQPLLPYRFADRGYPAFLSYRVFDKTIDVQPTELAGRYPLRFKYIYQPVFGDTDTNLDLPLGADDYLSEAISIKIRNRFEEAPEEHLTAMGMAMQVVTRFLVSHDQGPPDQVPEAGDYPDTTMGDF